MRQKNLNILDSLSHNYFRASIHCKLAHHFFLLDYFCVIENLLLLYVCQDSGC